MKQQFSAVVYQEGDIFVAECPQVGTASQGGSIEEALSNLKEATELFLDEFPPKNEIKGQTILTTFEADYAVAS
jgi:predicted RNase H-like HicB family nuclease